MVVNQDGPGAPPVVRRGPGGKISIGPRLRLALWAAMAASVFWTLIYQLSNQHSDVPEFVYVNF